MSVLDTGLTIILMLESMLKWVNLLNMLTENSFKKGSKMCDGENTQMTNTILFLIIWQFDACFVRKWELISLYKCGVCLERERERVLVLQYDWYSKGKTKMFKTKSIPKQHQNRIISLFSFQMGWFLASISGLLRAVSVVGSCRLCKQVVSVPRFWSIFCSKSVKCLTFIRFKEQAHPNRM